MPLSTTTAGTATIHLGLSKDTQVTIRCDIVHRCEGYVPRFTIRQGDTLVGGDTHHRFIAARDLLQSELGIPHVLAAGVLQRARDEAQAGAR